MKRHHHMPFGAEFDGAGAVRFKLWAPQASEVRLDVVRSQGKQSSAMLPTGEGWFALTL